MIGFKLKIILTCIGKMNFIQRFIKIRFTANYKLMIGVNLLVKYLEFEPGEIAILSIWDISEQQRFEFLRKTFYKGASGALLIFDLSKAHTFELIKKHHTQIQQIFGKNFPFLLIGNEIYLSEDRSDVIDLNIPREFAEKERCIYIENSPKSEGEINKAFAKLTRRIIQLKTPTKIIYNL